jgi:dTDP-4-dehydrorhamnose reductase
MVLGANGVLGNQLAIQLQEKGHAVERFTRDNFELSDEVTMKNLLEAHSEFIVLNCVGFMPADKCETEPLSSRSINLDFPNLLSRLISTNKKQKLIHFSTDFVFNGENTIPYTEESVPSPINVYGAHKLESESQVITNLESRVRVIRFASLVSTSIARKTFVEKVIDRARSDGKISLVDDLRISMATSELITLACENAFDFQRLILHCVHSGETSWLEIAKRIFAGLCIDVEINPVSSSSFTTAAARPQFSVLEPSSEILNLDAKTWDLALDDFIAKNSLSL